LALLVKALATAWPEPLTATGLLLGRRSVAVARPVSRAARTFPVCVARSIDASPNFQPAQVAQFSPGADRSGVALRLAGATDTGSTGDLRLGTTGVAGFCA
jgi:hypothetical protein